MSAYATDSKFRFVFKETMFGRHSYSKGQRAYHPYLAYLITPHRKKHQVIGLNVGATLAVVYLASLVASPSPSNAKKKIVRSKEGNQKNMSNVFVNLVWTFPLLLCMFPSS